MKKIIVSALLFVLIFGSVSLPHQVQAQTLVPTTPGFSTVSLDIRPEFDTPSVLVIYRLVLKPDTKLPATITFRLPARIGSPNAVAWVDPADGNPYNLNYQSSVDQNDLNITFMTTGNEIQLEYYDPALQKTGNHREFTYEWPGDFSIGAFNINIQQPLGATNTVISPSLGAGQKNDSGVEFYIGQIGSVAAGTSFKIDLQYDKASDAISAQQLPVQPSAPINSQTKGRTTITEVLPWMVGLLLIVLAAMIGWVIWNTRNSDEKKMRHGKRHTPSIAKVIRDDREEFVYCHECGQRAEDGDLFCRACGTKLRRS